MYTILVHLHTNDSAEDVEKLNENPIEASQVYGKDQEAILSFVMEDHQDARAFSIVKRYEQESERLYPNAHSASCQTLTPRRAKSIISR